MVSASRRSGLLLAIAAIPALTGCAALGLPQLPGSSLLEPAGQTFDASPGPGGSPDPAQVMAYVASPDGYSMSIPSGWATVDLSAQDGLALADMLAVIDPGLGALGRLGLETSGARLSLLAVDLVAAPDASVAPGIVVVTMRTRGMPKDAARSLVEDLLAGAPLGSQVVHSVQGLPAGDAHRYDAILLGDTVTLQLQAYVFRVGGDSFVVAAVAPSDRFGASQAAFDAIVKSLRFGV
jgi:hypothetical protein